MPINISEGKRVIVGSFGTTGSTCLSYASDAFASSINWDLENVAIFSRWNVWNLYIELSQLVEPVTSSSSSWDCSLKSELLKKFRAFLKPDTLNELKIVYHVDPVGVQWATVQEHMELNPRCYQCSHLKFLYSGVSMNIKIFKRSGFVK